MSMAHLALNYRPQGVTGDPQGIHRGPSEGGQTWPQIAQLPRSVFTGWTVKYRRSRGGRRSCRYCRNKHGVLDQRAGAAPARAA